MAEVVVKRKTFVIIWAVLICLTILTAVASEIEMGQWNAPVAMAIAGTKALLVALFFMHLRHSTILTKVVVGGGMLWLGILLVLSLSDFVTRGWLPVPGK